MTTQAKHTPAPWNYVKGSDTIETRQGVAVAHIPVTGTVGQPAANGCLIAAAPDLLESLKNLVYAVAGPDTPGYEGILRMRLNEARIIIAKAEGGAK